VGRKSSDYLAPSLRFGHLRWRIGCAISYIIILFDPSCVERRVQISLVLSLWNKEEKQDKISTRHDRNKPMIPAPTPVLNQEAADRWRQGAPETQPDGLDPSLGASFMKEEDVMESSHAQRLARSACSAVTSEIAHKQRGDH
jgi:hypothetical protein